MYTNYLTTVDLRIIYHSDKNVVLTRDLASAMSFLKASSSSILNNKKQLLSSDSRLGMKKNHVKAS